MDNFFTVVLVILAIIILLIKFALIYLMYKSFVSGDTNGIIFFGLLALILKGSSKVGDNE